MENIIKVTQLPVIEENLRNLANNIDEKVNTAINLVCSVDTYKDVKAVRTELNKDFKALEEQRKAVKTAVLEPYNKFEAVYKECVSNKFKVADADLKNKIDEVENALKEEKSEKVRDAFDKYKSEAGLDWLSYESAGIKINLSDSDKKLIELAKEYIDKVKSAVEVISMQEYPEEILIEYKKTLDLQASIKDVLDRKAQLAAIQAEKEESQFKPSVSEEVSLNDILNSVADEMVMTEKSLKRIIVEDVTNEEVEQLSVIFSKMNLKWRVE